ncbi:MAG: hypothetical protein AB1815_02460 [Bacillota bacterium]
MSKKVQIKYLLSGQGRKNSILAGGDGKELQTLEVDITPQLVELGNVTQLGDVMLNVGFRLPSWKKAAEQVDLEKKVLQSGYSPGWYWNTKSSIFHFDTPQTPEALLTWEQARVSGLTATESDPENLAKIAAFEAAYAERQARDEAARAKQLAREEAFRAERQAREAEKAAWIAAHGSDYLKRAAALGYDCQRQYVTERAAREVPGFILDFHDRAEWKSRACPSEEALGQVEALLEQGFQAEVVWLTRPADAEPDNENFDPYQGFEPCEAVVVSNYLGKYTLVCY